MASSAEPLRRSDTPDIIRSQIKENFLLESNRIKKGSSLPGLSYIEKSNFQNTLIKSCKLAKKEGVGQLLRRGTHNFKRSVYITPQNDIFILFNTKEDRLIARGGQKKVKLALNAISGQLVAYKVSRELYTQEEQQPVIDEYELGLTLTGDALCRPIEGSLRIEKDRIVYLENFMPCKDLTRYLDQTIEKENILPLALQMANAAAELHKQGYISRDIKPANYFIESNDQSTFKIRLGDFGEAVPIHSMTTKKQMPIWTYGFVSPEYKRAASKERPERFSAVAEATTLKLDSWALGMSMLSIFQKHLGEFIDSNSKLKAFLNADDQNLFVEKLFRKSKWIRRPENKNTIEYVIRKLLMINPERRWTPRRATNHLKTMLTSPLDRSLIKTESDMLADQTDETINAILSDLESMATELDSLSRTPSPIT
jgi:serine/threonine protein kinase